MPDGWPVGPRGQHQPERAKEEKVGENCMRSPFPHDLQEALVLIRNLRQDEVLEIMAKKIKTGRNPLAFGKERIDIAQVDVGSWPERAEAQATLLHDIFEYAGCLHAPCDRASSGCVPTTASG